MQLFYRILQIASFILVMFYYIFKPEDWQFYTVANLMTNFFLALYFEINSK